MLWSESEVLFADIPWRKPNITLVAINIEIISGQNKPVISSGISPNFYGIKT
jgi:hypothetical protein